MIYFTEAGHKYLSNDGDNIEWTSVTTLLELFTEEFDERKVASKCSTGEGKTKKYIGLSVDDILDIWSKENKRATDLGSRYHYKKEKQLIDNPLQEREGLVYPVYPPIMSGDKKLSIPQQLTEGIYAEHMMFLKSAKICGQSDRVEIIKNYIDVYDHKTNKKLEFEGFKNRLGVSKKMLRILKHLDDCNFIHYSLQLSIYMYMIRKHNYNLTPRHLKLEHVLFETKSVDEYGFPIYHLDDQGNPIIKSITSHPVDYMEREAISIINFIKENSSFLKTFKEKKYGK
jgi:hypothetical protein